MDTVVFVAGSAGTGKSTLGDELAARLNGVHLDFDLVSAGVVERAKDAHQGLAEAELLEAVKNARYDALHDALTSTLAQGSGTPIVVSAPFTRQSVSEEFWARWGDPCPRWVLIWLHLDEDERIRRILTRGATRDRGARGVAGSRPGVTHLALDAALPTDELATLVLAHVSLPHGPSDSPEA